MREIQTMITVGTGYVDNVTLFVTGDSYEDQTEQQVHKKLRHMASTWEKSLFIQQVVN